MTIKGAKDCFEDNFKRYGDSRTDPERFNLYRGLFNLADAVGRIQAQLDAVTKELASLRREVATLQRPPAGAAPKD